MIYVISRLCRDCVDGACALVCPVPECIVEHRPAGRPSELPNQLFINPDQCIGCAACEPACPWDAIFPEDRLPAAFSADAALNERSAARPEEYVGAAVRMSRR
jgi:ferredoxin